MMFGHNDEDQHHDNNQEHNAPISDGALDDNSSIAAPTAAPALPSDDDAASDFIMTDAPHADSAPEPSTATESAAKPQVSDDLLRIKQEAIQELAPMVDHLDQSPEEKFRTTMMMIQATDNDKLIPAAYKAAKAISDEKVRAQAYLDIVNEINYFTQAEADKAA